MHIAGQNGYSGISVLCLVSFQSNEPGAKVDLRPLNDGKLAFMNTGDVSADEDRL